MRSLGGAILLSSLALATTVHATDLTGTVVLPAGRAISDSVVYLVEVPGRRFDPPAEPAIMDQRLKVYIPHVLVVQRGQRVEFPNTDLIRHNVFSPSKTKQFNLGIYPPGIRREQVFEQPGLVSLLCNVHPEMSAFILVVTTPFFARTDADGTFVIKGLPPGRYDFVAWHEGMAEVRESIQIQGARVEHAFTLHKK
jgi:hypothetical protein